MMVVVVVMMMVVVVMMMVVAVVMMKVVVLVMMMVVVVVMMIVVRVVMMMVSALCLCSWWFAGATQAGGGDFFLLTPPTPPFIVACFFSSPLSSPLSPFISPLSSLSSLPLIDEEATYTWPVGERVMINHGTHKVRGGKTIPFRAIIVSFEGCGKYKVRRCEMPQRTSAVDYSVIEKISQYECCPFSFDTPLQVRNLSKKSKTRLLQTLNGDVTFKERRGDRRSAMASAAKKDDANCSVGGVVW